MRDRQIAGAKFRRQQALAGFVVDFCCMEVGLIVELDGGHHAERVVMNAQRTEQLQAQGWYVLRFWDDEGLKNTDAVLERIRRAIEEQRATGNRYGG